MVMRELTIQRSICVLNTSSKYMNNTNVLIYYASCLINDRVQETQSMGRKPTLLVLVLIRRKLTANQLDF